MKQQKFVYAKHALRSLTSDKKLSIAALVFGAAMLLLSCQNREISEEPVDIVKEQQLPSVDAVDFELTNSISGQKKYKLTTPRLLIFDSKDKAYKECPEGFHIVRFNDAQQISSQLSANYGKQFEKEELWEAEGNVILVNEQGDTLKTEHLVWNQKEEMIYSDKFVRIIRDNQVITGIGLEADQELKKYKILEPKGTMYVETE